MSRGRKAVVLEWPGVETPGSREKGILGWTRMRPEGPRRMVLVACFGVVNGGCGGWAGRPGGVMGCILFWEVCYGRLVGLFWSFGVHRGGAGKVVRE